MFFLANICYFLRDMFSVADFVGPAVVVLEIEYTSALLLTQISFSIY
jgi:hypothetical protein